MRSDELIAAVRLSVFNDNNHPDYPNSVLLTELNDAMKSAFTELITAPRCGHWLKHFFYTITAGRPRYRIPYRAAFGGIESVAVSDSAGTFHPLNDIPESQSYEWESFQTSRRGLPSHFAIRGDQLDLLPDPDTTALQLRISFYLRPSRLVTSQSSALAGAGDAVIRGQVTAVNTTARTITVNVVPFDQELATPAAITSAVQRIDVIHPNGTYELALVNATQTLAGSVFTVGGTDDMGDIEVGDFVRAAEQTDWPALPEDYHRLLAEIASIKPMLSTGLVSKAGALAQTITGDMGRLKSLIAQPRTRSKPRRLPLTMITQM